MSRTTPSIKFPTRAAAIHAMRLQSFSTEEIAKRLGCTERQVYKADWSQQQRERSSSAPTIRSASWLVDILPNDPDAKAKARRAAARRGLSLEGLVRQAVEVLIEDDLWNAVLDDEARRP